MDTYIYMNLNIANKRTYMLLNVDLLKLTILILNNFLILSNKLLSFKQLNNIIILRFF